MAIEALSLLATLGLDSSEYEKGLEKSSEKTQGFSAVAVATGKIVADAFEKGIGAVVNFAKSSIQSGMEFDTAVSQIAATTGKTVDEIDSLREAAQHMGATTAFTATQAAEGINILAMAGVEAEDIISGMDEQTSLLDTTLSLASAGALSLEQSATYLTGAIKGFGDEASNAGYYADLMAKGATLANTNVSQLGEALGDVSATASSYNQSADGMTVALLKLAEANVTGSAASTSLQAAMKNLYTPTDQAKKAMQELGVAAYKNGQALDFNDIVQNLTESLAGYSDEQKNAYLDTIFGIQGLDAYNKMAAVSDETTQKFYDGLSEASGAAGDQAATQLDNLEGKLTLFESAMDGLKQAVYGEFSEALKGSVATATDAVTQITTAFQENGVSGVVDAVSEIAAQLTDGLPDKILSGVDKITESAVSIIEGLASGLRQNVPKFISEALPMLLKFTENIKKNIGKIVESGISMIMGLVDGLIAGLPDLIKYVPVIVSNIANIINDNMPKIIKAGFTIIVKLVKGIIDNIPVIIQNIPQIITAIVNVITAFQWMNLGKKIIEMFGKGITAMKTSLGTSVKDVINNVVNFFKELPTKALEWGKDMINGFINGIKDKAANSTLGQAVSGIADVVSGFLHHSTPDEGAMKDDDKWMPDFMDNLANGIRENTWKVRDAMSSLAGEMSMNITPSLAGSYGGTVSNNTSTYNITISAANVKEFNDIIRIAQNERMSIRQR